VTSSSQAAVEKAGWDAVAVRGRPGQAERPDCRHRPADLLRPDPVRVRGRPLPQQHHARPDAGPDSGGQVKAIAPKESAQAPIIYPLAPLGCSPRCDRGAVARSDAV